MATGLLDKAASILERRFLKNAFLPVLLFFPAIVAPTLAYTGELDRLIHAWEAQTLVLRLIEIAGYLAVTWFGAALVASQWRTIIRLFEGYPLEPIGWLDSLGKDWHSDRRERVEEDEIYSAGAYYEYPRDRRQILPTRLGNRLLAAERGPLECYEADTVFLWPRLYHVVPSHVVHDVEDARAELEFLLVLCLWFFLFAWIQLVVLTIVGAPTLAVAALFASGSLVAYALYRSALWATTEYGERLRSTVELYRHDLLGRLKLGEPEDIDDERAMWRNLRRYSVHARRLAELKELRRGWRYVPPASPGLTLGVSEEARVTLLASARGDARTGAGPSQEGMP